MLSIGAAGTANVQGEDQKKLDIISNDIMVDALKKCGKTAVLISEVRSIAADWTIAPRAMCP